MKNTIIILLVFLCCGCADHHNVQQCTTREHVYGFFGGLWHGYIAIFDFIGMLIWDDVSVYAESNNGGWYTFGFLLGIGAFGGTVKTVN